MSVLLCLFLLGVLDLSLLGASDLLDTVLTLLALLARHPLGLHEAVTHQAMLGLELLGEVERVVDEREAGALAAAEHGLEAEAEDNVRLGLVHSGELLADLGLLDRRLARVQNVNDLLITTTKSFISNTYRRRRSIRLSSPLCIQ